MIDRQRFSGIAHRDHLFHSPLGEAKVARLLGLLDLPPNPRVLDVGCSPPNCSSARSSRAAVGESGSTYRPM